MCFDKIWQIVKHLLFLVLSVALSDRAQLFLSVFKRVERVKGGKGGKGGKSKKWWKGWKGWKKVITGGKSG